MHVQQGVAVVLGATSFHHGRQRDVMDALDLAVLVEMVVALEDRQNGP